MTISYFDDILVENRSNNINKFIFESVRKINEYNISTAKGEKIYWK
jgi:hypothetical protein